MIGVGRDRHHYNIYCTFGVVPYFDTLVALERKMVDFPWVIRCHQSAIVNVRHVKAILSGSHEIVMDNDLRFPVSRRRYRLLVDLWNER